MTTMAKTGHSVSATEFKAKCLDLMDRVAERRETYTITKHGKPVAQLAPVPVLPADDISGCLRGQAWAVGDILGPVVPTEGWNAVQDERSRSRRRLAAGKVGARKR